MSGDGRDLYSTPKRGTNAEGSPRKRRTRTPSLKALERLASGDKESPEWPLEQVPEGMTTRRRSTRKISPSKRLSEAYVKPTLTRSARKSVSIAARPATPPVAIVEASDDSTEEAAAMSRPDLQLLQDDQTVAGKALFGFNTPKKRDAMALVALNTPKMPRTPKTPVMAQRPRASGAMTPARAEHAVVRRLQSETPRTPRSARLLGRTPDSKSQMESASSLDPKTPARLRRRVKTQIAQMVEELSGSDFSADSDFKPDNGTASSSSPDSEESSPDDGNDDEPKTPQRGRVPIVVPALAQTPSAARQRQSARLKSKSTGDYVPTSDGYFQAHASSRIVTSDHTLDRLRQPRLPADRVFSLLASMRLSDEHEAAMGALMEEYRSYFPKWTCLLHEGFNLLLYGLGTKRPLLQAFHRHALAQQPVLVVNGFFPSLTLKDILDSITADILDAGPSPASAHEAVDLIEEEFALMPETHLYLIVHSLDGATLRTGRIQETLARLAHVPNIHLLASIDHINTPLLWDQSRLSQFNFSWWDCTTMLPYADETAFENSLLVQNSGALAISSLRSVFSSLTSNSRGIFMQIVRHQLDNTGQSNYQGMPFKELYWRCREAFLVSSDMALRSQLTEFLDHKLVKSRRHIDGYEQLTVPIDGVLLQQFLEEHEKK